MHWLGTYWPLLAAAAALLLVVAVIFRARAVYLVRLGKAVATDERVPASVRWLFRVALAIKVIPGPDFGIDEAMLPMGVLLLAGPYWAQWREIRDEVRQRGG